LSSNPYFKSGFSKIAAGYFGLKIECLSANINTEKTFNDGKLKEGVKREK